MRATEKLVKPHPAGSRQARFGRCERARAAKRRRVAPCGFRLAQMAPAGRRWRRGRALQPRPSRTGLVLCGDGAGGGGAVSRAERDEPDRGAACPAVSPSAGAGRAAAGVAMRRRERTDRRRRSRGDRHDQRRRPLCRRRQQPGVGVHRPAAPVRVPQPRAQVLARRSRDRGLGLRAGGGERGAGPAMRPTPTQGPFPGRVRLPPGPYVHETGDSSYPTGAQARWRKGCRSHALSPSPPPTVRRRRAPTPRAGHGRARSVLRKNRTISTDASGPAGSA